MWPVRVTFTLLRSENQINSYHSLGSSGCTLRRSLMRSAAAAFFPSRLRKTRQKHDDVSTFSYFLLQTIPGQVEAEARRKYNNSIIAENLNDEVFTRDRDNKKTSRHKGKSPRSASIIAVVGLP